MCPTEWTAFVEVSGRVFAMGEGYSHEFEIRMEIFEKQYTHGTNWWKGFRVSGKMTSEGVSPRIG